MRRGAAAGCLLAPVAVPCWGPVAGWKIWTAERFLDETRGCSISGGTPTVRAGSPSVLIFIKRTLLDLLIL